MIQETFSPKAMSLVLPESIIKDESHIRASSPQPVDIQTVEEPMIHDFTQTRYQSLVSAAPASKPYMRPGFSCILEASDSKMEVSSHIFSEHEQEAINEDTEFFGEDLQNARVSLRIQETTTH